MDCCYTFTVFCVKYTHGFLLLCFVVVILSVLVDSCVIFTHILEYYFTGTQWQRSNPGSWFNIKIPDSKVHGANMGPIWGRQDPGGPHVGPMSFAIWDVILWPSYLHNGIFYTVKTTYLYWIRPLKDMSMINMYHYTKQQLTDHVDICYFLN